jgi:hypothetical protein
MFCPPLNLGDRIEIFEAVGCVNSGGDRLTSRHYITPLDENGNLDTLHYGMIAIVGSGNLEKAQEVSIKYFMENMKSITITSQSPSLCLGYKDDNYRDNSYVLIDSGYRDQCLNQGLAQVVFRITRLR